MAMNLQEYFPHETMRPQQKYILDEISKNEDKRYIFLECPTGIGKSAIAKTLANYYNKSYIMVTTKQLQDQYMSIYNYDNEIVSIKGRANYKCKYNEKYTVENAPCISGIDHIKCDKGKDCPYWSLRDATVKKKSVVSTYQYLLRAFDCAKFWKTRDLMVLDECHELENQIMTWGRLKLNINTLIKEGIISKNDKDHFVSLLLSNNITDYIGQIYHNVILKWDDAQEEIKRIYKYSEDAYDLNDIEYSKMSSTYEKYKILDIYFRRLDVFIRTYNDKDNWHVKETIFGEELELIPIKIGDLFNVFLNKKAREKVLFMSSSILDIESYIKELRIDRSRCLVLKMDSYFNPKLAPIINCDVAKMNYLSIKSNIPKMVNYIDKIIDSHNNEKGIIHTGNYYIARQIYENSKYKDRLIIKTNNDENNEILIKKHINSKKPTILLSPSLTTGLDLYDDLGRFQIIVKLPWKSMKDELIAYKLKFQAKFYTIDMLRTLLQSCGRTIRNDKDWCVTYVLDSSFEFYMKRYGKYFYPQFLKRIIYNKSDFNLKQFYNDIPTLINS